MDPVDVCRICGSTALERFVRLGTPHGRCGRCGAVLKLLTAARYEALAVTYATDPHLHAGSPDQFRSLLEIEAKRDLLGPVLARFATPGRFLDIGCGQGGYLVAARDLGWEVVGVEPSSEHSLAAREVFGLAVRHGPFSRGLVGDAAFDVIMLSHVIEHQLDPNGFVAQILEVLAPGGVLVITTPNADSTVARLSGRYWTMLRPVDHVSLLTSRAFEHMAALRGLGCKCSDSEYPSEPVTALVMAGRDFLRELRRSWTEPAASEAQTAGGHERRRYRTRWLLKLLSLVAFPVHSYNVRRGRQACLVVEIHRPGKA